MNCTDHRFRFLDLDRHGKQGVLVAHASPPWAQDFGGLSDAEVRRGHGGAPSLRARHRGDGP